MNLSENKNVFIIGGSVLLAIVLVGGIFVFTRSQSVKKSTNNLIQQQQVFTLQPQDIGFTLSLIQSGKFANNGVELLVTKLSGITGIDYELDYTATGDLPRGAIGHVDIKSSDTEFRQQLPFGTCSDKCHFDSGVSNVKVTLKVTKSDGKVYSVVQPFSL